MALNPKKTINIAHLSVRISDLIISMIVSALVVLAISYFPISKLTKLNELQQVNLHFQDESSGHLILSACFAILIVISMMFIFSVVHNQLQEKKLNDIGAYKEKYQNYFTNVITEQHNNIDKHFEQNNSKEKEHLQLEDISDPKNRTILLNELKGMHAIITGSEKERLREMYFGMGFVAEIPRRLASSNWVTRVEAIQEVRQFTIAAHYDKVFEMVNDKHETVRRNAILSRIVLDEDPLNILHDVTTPLSMWERHNILSALEKLPSHKVPLFCTLYLEAPVHVEFLRELCVHFHQKTSEEQQPTLQTPIVA